MPINRTGSSNWHQRVHTLQRTPLRKQILLQVQILRPKHRFQGPPPILSVWLYRLTTWKNNYNFLWKFSKIVNTFKGGINDRYLSNSSCMSSRSYVALSGNSCLKAFRNSFLDVEVVSVLMARFGHYYPIYSCVFVCSQLTIHLTPLILLAGGSLSGYRYKK